MIDLDGSVLIQNMAFIADSNEESELTPYLEVLRKMAELEPNDHILQWVYSDANKEIQGHFMMRWNQN